MPSIESPALRFVDDVKSMERDYAEEAKQHNEALQSVVDECEERLRAARKAHREKALEVNEKYRERVAQAARIRASKASDEAAKDIKQAAAHMGALVGGACHDMFTFNADFVRASIENAANERERIRKQREDDERKGAFVYLL